MIEPGSSECVQQQDERQQTPTVKYRKFHLTITKQPFLVCCPEWLWSLHPLARGSFQTQLSCDPSPMASVSGAQSLLLSESGIQRHSEVTLPNPQTPYCIYNTTSCTEKRKGRAFSEQSVFLHYSYSGKPTSFLGHDISWMELTCGRKLHSTVQIHELMHKYKHIDVGLCTGVICGMTVFKGPKGSDYVSFLCTPCKSPSLIMADMTLFVFLLNQKSN